MAKILYKHHENTSRALVEGALEARELGFTDASGYQEAIIKTNAGAYRHFPSLERLDDTTASAGGARLIGVEAFGGFASTNVQDLLEEMNSITVAGAVIVNPGSSTRNRITPTGDFIPFVVRGSASQTANLFVAENTSGTSLFSISAAGAVSMASTLAVSGAVTIGLAGSTHGIINSAGSIFFNIDSNADESTRQYAWGKDSTGTSHTRLMSLWESGNLRIGSTDTDPGIMLTVDGTGHFAGATTMASTLSVTSTTTLTSLAGTGTRLVTATSTGVLGNATVIAGNIEWTGTHDFQQRIGFSGNGSSTTGAIWRDATNGLNYRGVAGSANSFALFNKDAVLLMSNPNATNSIVFPSDGVTVGSTTNPSTKLFVVGGSGASAGLRLQTNETDATNKEGRIKGGHYTNSEEPVTMLWLSSTSGASTLYIGGNSSAENAVTAIDFLTAANTTTVTGTRRGGFNSSGTFDLTGNFELASTSSTAIFRGTVEVGNPPGATATLKLGQINALPTNVDASWIYTTNTSAGSYPFNAFGNLVLQPRSASPRDIVFMTSINPSTTPTVAMAIEEAAASRISMSRAVTMASTLDVTGSVTLSSNLRVNGTIGLGNSPASAIAINVDHSALSGTSQYAIVAQSTFTSAATVSGIAGWFQVKTAAAVFTMATAIGINIQNATKGAGSTITTLYGLKIEDQTQGGTNYAIYTGAGQVRFGGAVSIIGASLTLDNAQQIVMKNASGTSRNVLALQSSNNLEIGGTIDGGMTFLYNLGNTAGSYNSSGAWTFNTAVSMSSTLAVTGIQTNATDLVLTASTAIIRSNTSAGSDSNRFVIAPSGSPGDVTRSGFFYLEGNAYGGAGLGGDVIIASGNTVGGTLVLATGAQTARLTIDSSGAAQFSGTLGVTGAATMSSTLAVNGAATMSSTLGVTGIITGNTGFVGSSAAGGYLQLLNSGATTADATAAFIAFGKDASSGIRAGFKAAYQTTGYVTDNNVGMHLDFYTAANSAGDGTRRMRITAGGRVIVNTITDHGETFQVDGTSYFTGAATMASTLAVTSTTNLTGIVGIGTSPSTDAKLTVVGQNLATANQFGANISVYSTTSAIDRTEGLQVFASTSDSSYTCASLKGIFIGLGKGAASTVSEAYGLKISDITQGTLNWAIYTGSGSVRFGGPLTLAGSLVAGGTSGGYDEGTFTGTLTGCTTSPTVTVKYVRVGKMVMLYIPALTGTSNASTCSMTGLPSSLQPASTRTISDSVHIRDNGTILQSCSVTITGGSDTLTFIPYIGGAYNPSGFTTSGSKGLPSTGTQIYYSID